MDFSLFDRRGYPVVSVEAGYAEWASDYDSTVAAGLEEPLLESLTSVNWREVRRAAALACGTGRTGVWLKSHGVQTIHGVDLTQKMLDIAASKHAHEELHLADVASTPLASSAYDLCMLVLADEHLAELGPMYREAARLLVAGGPFFFVRDHPFFFMQGRPTHYHRGGPGREGGSIWSYVYLFCEHCAGTRTAGARGAELPEWGTAR